jgi:hypothetical protein
VSFLFVSLDEKKETFLEFFTDKKVPENFVFLNRDRKILENFGVKSIPQNMLIDPDGDWKNYSVLSPSQGLENVLKQLK